MINWLGGKKDESKVVAVINIGSAAVVGGLLFLPAPNDVANPHYLVEETAVIDVKLERLTLKRYLPAVFAALDAVVSKLLTASEKVGRPRRVVFTLPSLLVLAQTKTIKLQDQKTLKINQRTVDDLAFTAAEQALAENPALYQEFPSDRTVILEQEVIAARADGYLLPARPTGAAKELILTTRLVLSSRDFLRNLKEWARRLKPVVKEVVVKTFVAAAASVLPPPDFVIVDPNGVLSEIVVVKNKRIVAEGSFPLGEVNLLEGLGQKLETDKNLAASLLSLQQSKALATAPAKILTKAVEDFRRRWLLALKDSLNRLLQADFLPPTIFVSGGGVADQLFVDWLAKDGLAELTVSHQAPEVILVSNKLWLLGWFCDKIKDEL